MTEGAAPPSWREKLEDMVKVLGLGPLASVLEVDEDAVEDMIAGRVPIGASMERSLERMDGLYRTSLGWDDEQAYGVDDDGEGVPVEPMERELLGDDLGMMLPVPAVPGVDATRTWSWEEHMAERRNSLRATLELARMVQYRLNMGYQGRVAMMGLVAKIELALIYLGETLPEPGMDWDGDRRLREQNRRQSRLIWVEREQDREYGGMRGIMNWLMGRERPSAKELIERMIAEADAAMGVLPEVGPGMRLLPGEERHSEEMMRYVDAAGVIEGEFDGGAVVESG